MYSPEWIRSVAGTSEAQRTRSEAAAEAWVNKVMQNSKLKSYTQGKTAESIQNQVRSALEFSLPYSAAQAELTNYHFIEHPDELKVGRFVRWVTCPGSADAKLTNGGIVVRVLEEPATETSPTETSPTEEYCPIERYSPVLARVSVCWKSAGRRPIMGTFLLDNCVVFQKLSNEEQLVLSADKYRRTRNPFSEIRTIDPSRTEPKSTADTPAFLLNRNRAINWNEDSSSDDSSSDDDSSDEDY